MSDSIFVRKYNTVTDKNHKNEKTVASISVDTELFNNMSISDTEYLVNTNVLSDTDNLVGGLLKVNDYLINKDYFPSYSDIKSQVTSSTTTATTATTATSTYVDSMRDKYSFTPIITTTTNGYESSGSTETYTQSDKHLKTALSDTTVTGTVMFSANTNN